MNDIELKQNESGEVVQVVTTVNTEEVPISSAELDRQIAQQTANLNRLIAQRDVVKAFEDTLPKPSELNETPGE